MFRKSELALAKELMGEEAGRLRLPIILEVTTERGGMVAEVGEPDAIKLICRVLGIKEPEKPPLRLYPLQLSALRRVIGTLLMYAISFRSLSEL